MNSISKNERQELILSEVLKKNFVSIDNLTLSYGVSDITIRRDLDDLSDEGKLQRIRGGARRLNPKGPEPPVIQRQLEQVEEKNVIAERALDFIRDGEIIALESGSTTLILAQKIARLKEWKNLHVITNSFPILQELIGVAGVHMVFIGGVVDSNEMCTVGSLSVDNLKILRIDNYFAGCRGIDVKFGRSSDMHSALEISTVQAFSDASARIFILADHTKFGHTFVFQLLPVSRIDVVVTSNLVPTILIEELLREGVEVVQAQLSRVTIDEN